MTTFTRTPQRLADWIAAGKSLPDDASGLIHRFLSARGVTLEGVTVWPDGRVDVVADDTYQKVYSNLDAIDPATIDPDRAAEEAAAQANASVMFQLDAFADAVEAGTPPTAAQTQATVARLVRVVQYLAERRR